MSETSEHNEPKLTIVRDLDEGVKCADADYNGEPHFLMYWSVAGKMTLLDREDAKVVHRQLGRWLKEGRTS